ARDMHISVRLDAWAFATHAPDVSPNFDFRVANLAVGGLRQEGEGVFSARLEDGTAYLLVTSWDRGLNPGPTASDALKDMLDAPRLIIDVRPNGGGDELHAQALASCLVGTPVVYARSMNIDPQRAGEFLGPFERVLEPDAQGTHFLGPVCVLMGGACMSSNEAFLLMARAAGATLIGQPSLGSSGNPRAYDMGAGITLLLPSWRSMTPEGEPIEGVGLQPDVTVEHSPRSGGARDPVIEAAIEHLRSTAP
ncbi:MAG: S41 family peptidase, partial [Phycisphaerales bacterium JB059]